MEKTPGQLYKERLKRVEDAIQLRAPDRVPFYPITHFFAVKYGGITIEEAMYHSDKWFAANKKMLMLLEPDLYFPPTVFAGRAFEAVECKQIKWPGHGVPANSTYQFIEGDYVKEDEYDAFLDDPSDYFIRTYAPRIFGTLEPLRMLPSIKSLFIYGSFGAVASTALFAIPDIAKAFESLYTAGIEAKKYIEASVEFYKEMAELGFPPAFGEAVVLTPYDVFSDMLRGMRGTMLDMYRQPDKLLEAIDKITPTIFQTGVECAKRSGNSRVFMPLHNGADGFMSLKQFAIFYWPSLKKLIRGFVDEGLIPFPVFEGDYTSRLEYLTELPKGKVMGLFDSTDIFRAKEILGDTMCIAGNMPVSLLKTGTPDQIKEYSKKLIDVVGKGGGFIMSARTILDDANPELVKIWADFTKEYGRYQ